MEEDRKEIEIKKKPGRSGKAEGGGEECECEEHG